MIDTKELRANARAVGIKNWFGMDGSRAVEIANELDRLYELERRTTQLTREQIEAELVRRGWFLSFEETYCHFSDKGGRMVFVNDRVFDTDFRPRGAYYCAIPLSAVTLQLLDAVLEGKSAN